MVGFELELRMMFRMSQPLLKLLVRKYVWLEKTRKMKEGCRWVEQKSKKIARKFSSRALE